MDEIAIGLLQACQEYVRRQQEMLPQLAAALRVSESEVYYEWALRRCAQPGKLPDANWTHFFHGYECDLRNKKDGRALRMNFGPGGRVDILDSWGVMRFIMTSVFPWREFPRLQAFFAKSGEPYNENSGSAEKLRPVWDGLQKHGFFQQADPALAALVARYSSRGDDGLTYIAYPPEITDRQRADIHVAHRQCLSQSALRFLETIDVHRQDNFMRNPATSAALSGD